MSSYLRICTELADVIEFGRVTDQTQDLDSVGGGAFHSASGAYDMPHHSEFERLMGLKDARLTQQRKISEKREVSLREIEVGRAQRAALRDQIQRARNDQLVAGINEEKDRKRQEAAKAKEVSLKQQLEDALSKHLIAAASAAGAGGGGGRSDPFLRFRAEDSRIRADKERLAAMKRVHGTGGSDLLRRFIEGATDWSLHAQESIAVDGNGNLSSDRLSDSGTTSTCATLSATPSLASSASSAVPAPATSSGKIMVAAPRIPTAANLVSAGLGNARAAEANARADNSNAPVKKQLDDLSRRDAADAAEWAHRRAFYDRERINVLREMHSAAGLDVLRSMRFSSTAVDPAASQQKGAVLGHDVAREEQRARAELHRNHPVDHYHAAVRDSVAKVNGAMRPWTCVSAQHRATLSGSERAASSSAQRR
jgi:hypothetical protein